MWSELTVEDTTRIQEYLTCYLSSSGRTGTVAQLRSRIKRSGYSFYLYEGATFELVLCLGRIERNGRYSIIDFSYTGQGTAGEAVPLYLDKIREYALAHNADTFYACMDDNVPLVLAEMLVLFAATPGVTLTQTPAPPKFIEVKLELAPATVPP